MRNTNEIYNIEHGTSISAAICIGCIQGWIGNRNSGNTKFFNSFVRNLGLSARLISVGLAVRIAGEFQNSKGDGSQ